jgi:hypothetical protein
VDLPPDGMAGPGVAAGVAAAGPPGPRPRATAPAPAVRRNSRRVTPGPVSSSSLIFTAPLRSLELNTFVILRKSAFLYNRRRMDGRRHGDERGRGRTRQGAGQAGWPGVQAQSGALPSFHLMLQPTLGSCSAGTGRPASTASAAARREAPVTGMPLFGRLSSNCPR